MNTYKAQQHEEALSLVNELHDYIKKSGSPIYDTGRVTYIANSLSQIKSKTIHPGDYEDKITTIINNAQIFYGNGAPQLRTSESENIYHNMMANLHNIRKMLDFDLNRIKHEKLFF